MKFSINFFPLEFESFERLIFISFVSLSNTYEDELSLTNYKNIHEASYKILSFRLIFKN
jgi:hypothetical protein